MELYRFEDYKKMFLHDNEKNNKIDRLFKHIGHLSFPSPVYKINYKDNCDEYYAVNLWTKDRKLLKCLAPVLSDFEIENDLTVFNELASVSLDCVDASYCIAFDFNTTDRIKFYISFNKFPQLLDEATKALFHVSSFDFCSRKELNKDGEFIVGFCFTKDQPMEMRLYVTKPTKEQNTSAIIESYKAGDMDSIIEKYNVIKDNSILDHPHIIWMKEELGFIAENISKEPNANDYFIAYVPLKKIGVFEVEDKGIPSDLDYPACIDRLIETGQLQDALDLCKEIELTYGPIHGISYRKGLIYSRGYLDQPDLALVEFEKELNGNKP